MKSSKDCVKHSKAAVRAAFLSGIAALACQIPLASAADYGVGVFHNGQGSTVVAPIRLESLTVEPEVTLHRASGGGQTSNVTTLGTGIYVRKELGSLFESYLGGRVGYTSAKTPSSPVTETRTYSLTPTFGVQHFFSKQFSIGLDVGLRYSNSSQKSLTTTHTTNLDTDTRILLRAYF